MNIMAVMAAAFMTLARASGRARLGTTVLVRYIRSIMVVIE
jgi:hypothetical protein